MGAPPLRRSIASVYDLVAYGLALATVAYAVGFLANARVPKSVDAGVAHSIGDPLVVNLALVGLFGLQHSLMARPGPSALPIGRISKQCHGSSLAHGPPPTPPPTTTLRPDRQTTDTTTSPPMTEPTPPTDEQIRDEWTIGSYATLAQEFLPLAAELVDTARVGPGDRVLDVACGTGNVALTAARRGATVTGVDITPAMLEQARQRARWLDITAVWREGDATALPFDDDTFDLTLSCLGHIFAHDASSAAAELVRVTRPGGRIAFTAWTPESGIAAMMKVLSSYLPPQPASPSPFLWGEPAAVQERFGDRVEGLESSAGTLEYRALSPAHFWASMTTDSGAIIRMLEQVDDQQVHSLNEAMVDTLGGFFSGERNAMALGYRQFIATVV